MEDEDFHWLTGILEGEGTFVAGTPAAPHMPSVRVSMTDEDVLSRVASLFDRAVVPLAKRQDHHRRPFVTTIKGGPAVALMNAIAPWMGERRHAQIDRAIRSRPPGTRSRYRETASSFTHDGATCRPDRDLVWLAGLVEGEGWIARTTPEAGRTYPVLNVQMCDEDVVRRVASMIGAATVRRSAPRRRHWHPTFTAQIGGAAAAAWLRRLRPLMGERRHAAIDAALEAYRPVRLVDPPETCVVPGCSAPHASRGLCHKHYMNWLRDRLRGRAPRVTPLR